VAQPHQHGAAPTFQPVVHPVPGRGATARPRRRIVVLIAVLLAIIAGQSCLLVRLDQRIDATNRSVADGRRSADAALTALGNRTSQLEDRAGHTLDASAVAATVTPSVFRVVAGRSSGTAFAFGKEPTGGGTDLLTNFHVVDELYRGGGREVALERDNMRFTATIVKVGDGKDLALLHTAEKFARLTSAPSVATPGAPVVVVGAPLGLAQTVTTGVVSALRDNVDGPVVQFDAPINPGNSGGPVINVDKQVVGIATAKAATAEGIGLAIPIAVACATFGNC
jgi:S1-C subfamily serine protease